MTVVLLAVVAVLVDGLGGRLVQVMMTGAEDVVAQATAGATLAAADAV